MKKKTPALLRKRQKRQLREGTEANKIPNSSGRRRVALAPLMRKPRGNHIKKVRKRAWLGQKKDRLDRLAHFSALRTRTFSRDATKGEEGKKGTTRKLLGVQERGEGTQELSHPFKYVTGGPRKKNQRLSCGRKNQKQEHRNFKGGIRLQDPEPDGKSDYPPALPHDQIKN